jgi:hypothetical protein
MARFLKRAAPEEPSNDDPLAGVANLFDASIVFIVGLMVTLFSVYNMGGIMSGESELTLVKTDASGLSEIIVKKGETITAYKLSGNSGKGQGELLGTAYRLADGQIIYVPQGEGAETPAAAPDAARAESP